MGRTWKGTTSNSSGFVPGRGLLPETARPVRPSPTLHQQRSDLSSLLFLLLLLSLLRGLPNLLTARTLPLLSWLDVSHSMLGKLLLPRLSLEEASVQNTRRAVPSAHRALGGPLPRPTECPPGERKSWSSSDRGLGEWSIGTRRVEASGRRVVNCSRRVTSSLFLSLSLSFSLSLFLSLSLSLSFSRTH